MLERILLRIGDFVFVQRPLLLVPVWSFYLLGARAGERDTGAQFATDGAGVGLLSLTAVMVTAYLVNQIFDVESDRRNNKGFYIPLGIFRARTVLIMAMVAFAIASATFRESAPSQRGPLVLALVLSLTYSLPPLRLCARPLVDLAANAIGYGGVAFVAGYGPWTGGAGAPAAEAVPWVLLVGATFLHTTILDIDGDRATGKITSSVVLGERASALLAAVLALGAVGWNAWREPGDPLALAIPGTCAGVFVIAAVRSLRGRGMSSFAVQFATLAVTLGAAAYRPLYLAVLVPLVLVARVYYRARFGIRYPG